jgi:hypothetical protein
VTLILIMKELWRRRILVAAVGVVALLVAIFAVYNVSGFPPKLTKRNQVSAQGSIEVLVDSSRSPIAGSRRDIGGLAARAGVFARLMAGGNVIGQIAEEAGVPEKQIDVAGPTPLAGEAPGVSEAPETHRYGITFTNLEELPIVSVTTRAPTVAEARAMAAAAPVALGDVVRSIQVRQDTPPGERVELRVLGPPRAVVVDDSLGKKVALALFFGIFALGIGLILAVPRLRRAWSTVETEVPSWEPPRPESEIFDGQGDGDHDGGNYDDGGRHGEPDPQPEVAADQLRFPAPRVPQRQES